MKGKAIAKELLSLEESDNRKVFVYDEESGRRHDIKTVDTSCSDAIDLNISIVDNTEDSGIYFLSSLGREKALLFLSFLESDKEVMKKWFASYLPSFIRNNDMQVFRLIEAMRW
ncbi:hypothetical protein A3715_10285 [Oleiphilus sp. HI0009]|nr:hypothetical protein A3715_20630 [Oleiphilus sp. HI0009]KZX78246.1 hypothetical protein A3715_10285 [Oleiphilus sp. HI0009]